MNIHICMYAYINIISMRMTYDDDRHPHNSRHNLDTARVCERMRVYVFFTLSTASTDAPSSRSTRTVSACPRELAHSNAV